MLYIPYPTNNLCRYCNGFFPETHEYFRVQNGRWWHICPACLKAYNNRAADRRKEKRHQYDKEYRKNNAEYVRERTSRYYRDNADRLKEAARKDRSDHPDKYRAITAKSRHKHIEKRRKSCRDWQKKHPEQSRVNEQIRRARKRTLPQGFSGNDWQFCLEYFNHCCAVCGRPAGLWHTLAQDHWIPVVKGGGYTPGNIIPLCHNTGGGDIGCNNSKSARDPVEWLTEKVGKRRANPILKRINAYFSEVRR